MQAQFFIWSTLLLPFFTLLSLPILNLIFPLPPVRFGLLAMERAISFIPETLMSAYVMSLYCLPNQGYK